MRMPTGLSETLGSLKPGGLGSGAEAKSLRCRGAGTGVACPAGSSGSRGPPLCGARNATAEEERLGLRRAPVDDVDRLPRVEVGLVRALVRVEGPVLVERVAVEAVGRRVDGAAPLVVAGRDLGRVRAPVAVQVLAEVGRVVAGLLEPDGERVRVVELRVAAARRRVPHDAVVVGVLAGEEGRAGRAAERVRDEAVGERRAAVAQEALHVRHDAERLERLVVGHEHDDVRARLHRGRLRAVRACRDRRSRKEDGAGREDGQYPLSHGRSLHPRR